MAGTVVVATMAWRVYGPPSEQIEPLVDRARQSLAELLKPADESTLAEPGSPAPFDDSTPGLVQLTEGRRLDAAVGPAAWNQPTPLEGAETPVSPPALVPDQDSGAGAAGENVEAAAQMSAVYQRLRQLGVEQYGLSPWGTTPGLYRFRCSAPWGSEGAYHRYFEAVSADPLDAAQRVLDDVERWQTSQAGRTQAEIR